MALSNWDTCAWTESGEPVNGVFTSAAGVSVAIYKNWLSILDKAAWRPGCAYRAPVVMHVHAGDIGYMDVSITAVRGPQSGIYAAVWSGYDDTFRGMIGIGVYGYAERDSDEPIILRRGEDYIPPPWLGVLPSSIEWLKTEAFGIAPDRRGGAFPGDRGPAPVRLLAAMPQEVLRFNQGDQYITEHYGDETPVTAVGAPERPILERMFTKPDEADK